MSPFPIKAPRSVSHQFRNSAIPQSRNSARDRDTAARFAPILYQALGDKPRSDYITNFDFDGDWRGDNNWENAGNTNLALNAYVYYAVAETDTHFFIHYALFHPRDYKGGERKGTLLGELLREGAKHGAKYDPTGLAYEAALAHENDMEGALVVVKKNGNDLAEAQVAFVETLHHNDFSRYRVGDATNEMASIKIENQRTLLYVEPKGHGIVAFAGDQKQAGGKDFLRYVFDGRADDPAKLNSVCHDLESTPCTKSVSYDLVPISTTLWTRAKNEINTTYGALCDYGEVTVSNMVKGRAAKKKIKLGKIGCAFLGNVGGKNMARPPWGWFDKDERSQPIGSWFFDPATTVKRDFGLDASFSTTYIQLPFWMNHLH